jgi:hypothetical protein
MQKSLIKTPMSLCKSCRGLLDLQLCYLPLGSLLLQNWEKNWVKPSQTKFKTKPGTRDVAVHRVGPAAVRVCMHTDTLKQPPVLKGAPWALFAGGVTQARAHRPVPRGVSAHIDASARHHAASPCCAHALTGRLRYRLSSSPAPIKGCRPLLLAWALPVVTRHCRRHRAPFPARSQCHLSILSPSLYPAAAPQAQHCFALPRSSPDFEPRRTCRHCSAAAAHRWSIRPSHHRQSVWGEPGRIPSSFVAHIWPHIAGGELVPPSRVRLWRLLCLRAFLLEARA